MADLNFNANDVEPTGAFEPIPSGKYVAALIESGYKPVKSGSGRYLELKFQILDGNHKGRFLWARLCLEHSNEKTVQIARGQLSALCRAAGIMQPRDSVELHNIPITLRVQVRKNKETNELENAIGGYLKREAASAVPAAQAGSAPPWRKS